MAPVRAVVPTLTRWGLTPDADLIYRALSMTGSRTSVQLVQELGMSQRRVARALDDLVAVAAVRVAVPVSRVRDRAWAPVALDEVLRRLRRRREPPLADERWQRHDLTARERDLVCLLSWGHNDQSAAAELGLSVRTVAYTMRTLMDRLGVDNRFQLALVLGATGTVLAPPPHRPAIAGTNNTATS